MQKRQGMGRPAEAERDELKKQLAEARAEIERKDALIEQMRDALQMVRATSKSFLPGLTWQAVIAALAAERGE